ncbi:PHO85 cyclin-1 [Basidiobolus ranarum]|uniref:PHO85 cyclin-1 n=1 Tax=Basidiobolus ranarum TaxID=34480 RepID=A0ABR2VRX8_9FUNG
MVYLDRLRQKLPEFARGMQCTCHRIFLAALVIASKYLNDASPKNIYWARYTTIFSLTEVNLMERQLLELLKFDLRITTEELYTQLEGLTPKSNPARAHSDVKTYLPSNITYGNQRRHSDSFTYDMSKQPRWISGPSVKATYRSSERTTYTCNELFNPCPVNSKQTHPIIPSISESWFSQITSNQDPLLPTTMPSRKRRQVDSDFNNHGRIDSKRNRIIESGPYGNRHLSSVSTMLPPIERLHPQPYVGHYSTLIVHSQPRHSLPNIWEHQFHR